LGVHQLGGGDDDRHVCHTCVASTDIAAHGFGYDACDIPPAMTMDEFRRWRAIKHGPRHFRRLLKRLRSG
jgi:hypothetical protein